MEGKGRPSLLQRGRAVSGADGSACGSAPGAGSKLQRGRAVSGADGWRKAVKGMRGATPLQRGRAVSGADGELRTALEKCDRHRFNGAAPFPARMAAAGHASGRI